jgi:OmcA/MtrC family decaheme c-type cytochrome
MKREPLKQLGVMVISAAFGLLLIACRGAAGTNGVNGTNGTNGTDGTDGQNGTVTINAATLTTEQWAALKPRGQVTSVTMGGAPVVNFRLSDPDGNGIKGLGGFTSQSATATLPSYPNLAFTIAKFIPENPSTKAPSHWVNYIVTTVPTYKSATDLTIVPVAPTRPTTDNTGTLVDHGDGTYTYTFYRDITQIASVLSAAAATQTAPNDVADLGDVSYEPTRTHRLVIQFSGNARGTGSNTANGTTVATAVAMENPINIVHDFVPSTGSASADVREIGAIGKCNECHGKLAFHGGGRVELKYCVSCHTDQRKYGFKEAATTATGYDPEEVIAGSGTSATKGQRKINGMAVGDTTPMIHRIHMGANLSKQGYQYAGVYFDKLGYSMLDGGQRMCSKCHTGTGSTATTQGENWNAKPSRYSCGTCHDRVDFATGAIFGSTDTHVVQTTDTACAGCHSADDIKINHYTQNLTPNNPVVAAGLTNFTYEISSATQATAGGQVDVKFRILASTNGSTPAPVTFEAAAAGLANPLSGFTGGPSFLLAWAMPQEGITEPADYNNLTAAGAPYSSNHQPPSVSIANLLNTTASPSRGTMTGPDASGYYTAQIAPAYAFPAGAKLRTVALQGYFTQVSPAAARHAISITKTVTGDSARRKVIDNAKCANCHEWFEGHGGNRVYDVQTCVTCHVPGLTTSGRGASNAQISAYYPSFTADEKTALNAWTGVDFVAGDPTGTTANVALLFPQVTNNMKDMIHGIHAGKDRTTNPFKIIRNRQGTITIINSAKIGFPGILSDCQSCHTYNGVTVPSKTLASRDEAINASGNTTTVLANAALASLNAGDLMTTPFTAACVSCHDSAPAAAHMRLNGGQISVMRSSLNSAGESCAVCHGVGSTYDPAVVHK